MPLIARRLGRRRGFGTPPTTFTLTVLQLQCGLWQLGFDPGRFDGLWGPVTNGALDRWYLWWSSRQASPPPEPVVTAPRDNRSGNVVLPGPWSELQRASAAVSPCRVEPRGAHRAPPVAEPTPVSPPPVVVGPDGSSEPERPAVIQAGAAGLTAGTILLGALAIGVIGAAIYYGRREPGVEVDPELYTLAPPPPLTR